MIRRVYCAPTVFGPHLQKKNLSFSLFNSMFNLFIFRYSGFFWYWKGILAFIFEHIMGQGILCNK